MHQFNPNHQLRTTMRELIVSAGIILPKPVPFRDKVMGFMGSRGEYTVGDCVISTYGHYSNENDDTHYALKFYKGKDAYWHLATENKQVWFSPTGVFNLPQGTAETNWRADLTKLTDWELTPFKIDR